MSDATGTDISVKPSPSLARFFYNHNPFYLISCFLVIYGLQDWAVASGGIHGGEGVTTAVWMTGGMAAYTLLMTLTCVAVVRIGRIWEDARSLFMVVFISLVALSIGFDEICITHGNLAVRFAIASLFLTGGVIESLIRFCRLRLTIWYRLSLYAMFLVFFAAPPLLGHAVAHRWDRIAGGGSLLFSVGIATSMLILVPAMHAGPSSAHRNGTPWRWPWYPLSAFVVLVVMAGIRSHAIWMSFGFLGNRVTFEPLLLLPLLAAVIVLVTEAGRGLARPALNNGALMVTPALLLCGVANSGMSGLPIKADLAHCFGSGWTLAILVVTLLFVYMALRHVKHAEFGLPAMLLLAGIRAPLPWIARSAGLESWMLIATAGLVLAWIVMWRINADWVWAGLATIVTASMVMASRSYGWDQPGYLAAAVFALAAMMLIGAVFATELAEFLRAVSATLLTLGCGAASYRFLWHGDHLLAIEGLVVTGFLAYGYAHWVRRQGWFHVATLQAVVIAGLIGYHGYETDQLKQVNWPISSGLACFLVGIAITTSKTTFYLHARDRRIIDRENRVSPTYLPGL